ncbi:hypothetical protein IAT38_001391 [Cryptococcus sp. DSM 104549]
MSFLKISPCCLQGSVIPGTPRGTYEEIQPEGGRRVRRYLASPSDGVVLDKKTAVILYTDIFCFTLVNPLIMADAFADQLKLNVYVPEYIPNPPDEKVFDPVAPHFPEEFAGRSFFGSVSSWVGVLVRGWSYLPAMFNPNKQLPLAKEALGDLQKDGYTNLGAIGYCRGGTMVAYFLSLGAASPLTCGVLCHPSADPTWWKTMTKPSLWHLADHDPMFTEKKIKEFNEVFERKKREEGVEYGVTVYHDTSHGFAARPALSHEPTKKAFEEANATAVTFFQKHLLGKA